MVPPAPAGAPWMASGLKLTRERLEPSSPGCAQDGAAPSGPGGQRGQAAVDRPALVHREAIVAAAEHMQSAGGERPRTEGHAVVAGRLEVVRGQAGGGAELP